ncbi:DUF6882 domain-containing protein [Pseudactinotalea sp.]|uniref:DUF6882 domain-containing protein n=1 Tax=Pseudactinotalea sp. TaxID=1926260 RepID=UPI003B3AC4DF
MLTPAGIQSVADHGALYATIGQRRLQERLEAELGEFRWDADLPAGRVWFTSAADGSRIIEARAHLVASIAPGPRSILWGWAHPQAVHRGAAERLRALGEQHGIADLTAPEVPFQTDATGEELGADVANLAHVIAAAAVEATGETPYYSVPSGGGSRIVFLLEGVGLRPVDLARDGAGLTSALDTSTTTDQRASLLGLARHGNFPVREHDSTLEISDARGSRITAAWDAQGRLATLSLHLVPPPRS